MIKIYFKVNWLIITGCIIFCSCANEKKLLYFQKAINGPDSIKVAEAYVPHIEPGDIISIRVSSLSNEASAFFNPFVSTGAGSSTAAATDGYLVNAKGNIEIPLIGTTHVTGLTTITLMDTIKEKLKTYLKEPTVNVRLLNYKISILGEVSRPGVYVIPNEQITLPEALSLAGDLTPFAKRENILIVREVNGKKEFGHVDLNTREVYTSPYYYLRNNDLVYLEPSRKRAEQTDRTIQYASLAISVISFILVVFKVR